MNDIQYFEYLKKENNFLLLGEAIYNHCKQGGGQNAFARKYGFSKGTVSDIHAAYRFLLDKDYLVYMEPDGSNFDYTLFSVVSRYPGLFGTLDYEDIVKMSAAEAKLAVNRYLNRVEEVELFINNKKYSIPQNVLDKYEIK